MTQERKTNLGGTDTACRICHEPRRRKRRTSPVVLKEALITQILLQTNKIQQRLKGLGLCKCIVGCVVPLHSSASCTQQPVGTHPLHDGVHGHLVRDVETEKHSVPRNVRQPLDRVEVWHARGILQLNAYRVAVVGALIDICFIQRPRKGIRL